MTTRNLLIVVEVEDDNWRIKHYQKLGKPDEVVPLLLADDFLSADGEYLGPKLVRAEWVEQ